MQKRDRLEVVRDADDAPLAGARVHIRHVNGLALPPLWNRWQSGGGPVRFRPRALLFTGADGVLKRVLPPGRYVVKATAEGCAPAESPLMVTHERAAVVSLRLAPAER